MTRDRIYLISDVQGWVNTFYTLGAISDDSNLLMLLYAQAYGDNSDSPFSKKDLVTKAIDLESFKKIAEFRLADTSFLKQFTSPVQPYNLKIGSGVRYKGKSYQVIGFYYNTYAQRNVVSPILFNPQNMVNDALNLLYGVKTDDEVQEIINNNFKSGKYDEDFNFPLLPTVTDFKRYLSNITEPPITSLDVINVAIKKDDKTKIDLKPYKFEPSQVDFSENKQIADNKGIDENLAFAESFDDFKTKNLPLKINPFKYNFTERYKVLLEITKSYIDRVNLPYNLVELKEVIDSVKSDASKNYQTLIGEIKPLFVIAHRSKFSRNSNHVADYTQQIEQISFVSIREPKAYMSPFFETLLFSSKKSIQKTFDFDLSNKDFLENYERFLMSGFNGFLYEDYRAYVFKPDSFYGGFYFSSGYEDLNPNTDSEILPFGSVFQKGGIYYYVIKYVTTKKDVKCVCIKASTRNDIIEPKLTFDTKTEMKKYFKIFTKKQVYSSFKKEGHIFDTDDSYYTENQFVQNQEKSKSGLVTDLFLRSKKEQIEIVEKNFPKLNETFMGILSLLDKSLKSNDAKISSSIRDYVYVCLNGDIQRYSNSYPSTDLREKLNQQAKDIFSNVDLIDTIKSNTNAYISDVIYDLGFNTSYIEIKDNQNKIFFALNNLEEYQKYLLVRSAIHAYRNLQLISVVDEDEKPIELPIQNTPSLMTSDYFLGNISPLILKVEDKTYNTPSFLKCLNTVDSNYFASMHMPSLTTDLIKLSQSVFVINVLRLLILHIKGVIYAHMDNSSVEYIKKSNLLQYLKQFDISININYVFENFKELNFNVGSYTNNYNIDSISPSEFSSTEIYEASKVFFKTNAVFIIRFEEDGSKEALIQLIKYVDLIYNYEFLLTEKIVENTSNNILNDFPKPKPKPTDPEEEADDDLFDDDDIFSEALEDLGEEFLDEIDEIINIDIEDF